MIVIFTKCDAQEVKAMNRLCDEGKTTRQAVKEAPSHAAVYLQELEAQIKMTAHPPSAFVWLKGVIPPSGAVGEKYMLIII